MRFEVVKVTPEMAAKFLQRNEGNRKLREHRAAYLARAIDEGKYKLTHQAAAISKKGRVLDGQHRFRAICLANKTVDMVIAYDVPEDVFAVLDSGLPRKMHERLRADSRHTSICTTMYRLMCGRKTPHEFEIELMLETFEPALKAFEQVQRPAASKVDKAGISSAFVLRIAMSQARKDHDGVTRLQWLLEKLRRGDLSGAPPIIHSYYRQMLEGVNNLDIGVAPLTDQFVRAWKALDPRKEGITKVQIDDHGADIREARIEFKLVTQGVFDA